MLNKINQMNKNKISGLVLLVVILVIPLVSLAAWSNPACPATGCNTEAPITIASDAQSKGTLASPGSLTVFGTLTGGIISSLTNIVLPLSDTYGALRWGDVMSI